MAPSGGRVGWQWPTRAERPRPTTLGKHTRLFRSPSQTGENSLRTKVVREIAQVNRHTRTRRKRRRRVAPCFFSSSRTRHALISTDPGPGPGLLAEEIAEHVVVVAVTQRRLHRQHTTTNFVKLLSPSHSRHFVPSSSVDS